MENTKIYLKKKQMLKKAARRISLQFCIVILFGAVEIQESFVTFIVMPITTLSNYNDPEPNQIKASLDCSASRESLYRNVAIPTSGQNTR